MSIYDLIDQVNAVKVTKKKTHFNKAIITTLKHEGGFVNDPVDPGGATNWGMSLRYLKGRGDLDGDRRLDGDMDGDGDVDVSDIKKMTVEQAVQLYYTGFWLPYGYDQIEDYTIAAKLFDMTVNMGAIQAGRIVQKSLNRLGFGLKVDGAVGANTFKAIHAADPDLLIAEMRQEQARFYLNLIARRPEFAKYKNGWLRRAYA